MAFAVTKEGLVVSSDQMGGVYGVVVKTMAAWARDGQREKALAAVSQALYGEQLKRATESTDAEGRRVLVLETKGRPGG